MSGKDMQPVYRRERGSGEWSPATDRGNINRAQEHAREGYHGAGQPKAPPKYRQAGTKRPRRRMGSSSSGVTYASAASGAVPGPGHWHDGRLAAFPIADVLHNLLV